MDLEAALGCVHRAGLPRASGDGPARAQDPDFFAMAAPRERGWTLFGFGEGAAELGCPARAGIDPRVIDRNRLLVGAAPRG